MTVTITPSRLTGTITPPPSKSQAHRVMIAAALAQGISRIDNLAFSEDIRATLGALQELGACFAVKGRSAKVMKTERECASLPEFFCGESGSTLRFLIPIALAVCGGGMFAGKGRLMERPQQPYFEIFKEQRINYAMEHGRLSVRGKLAAGCYRLPGDVSSQFVTGLLFALPLLEEDSEIEITSPLESRGYVDMTLETLRRFGIAVENDGYRRFLVPGDQKYIACAATIESDYSQAAFYVAANALGNQVEIRGLNRDSVQGDRVILELSERLEKGGDMEVDVRQCPDLVPALAAIAALREGKMTRFTHAGRLRMKESDRLAAVSTELSALGARVEQSEDGLEISGVSRLRGGAVDSHNDHRIAMALAMAATRADGKVILSGAESVAKSYPDFWDDYVSLGGEIQ